MKTRHLIYVLLSVCFLCACTNDDDIAKYGDKQVLEGSEWIYTAVVYGGSVPERSLNFNANGEFISSHETSSYNEELQKIESTTIVIKGKYQYKHPKLILTSDTERIEAWISTKNSICFYEDDVMKEFVRQK